MIAPALTAAGHGNATAALSLFEQPLCSGVQGSEIALLRVRALRRIAKSGGPTAGGKRIDRTGDPATAKHNEEMAGADTRDLWADRLVLGTIQAVTVRHHGHVQTIATAPAGGWVNLTDPPTPAACRLRPREASLPKGASRATRKYRRL